MSSPWRVLLWMIPSYSSSEWRSHVIFALSDRRTPPRRVYQEKPYGEGGFCLWTD